MFGLDDIIIGIIIAAVATAAVVVIVVDYLSSSVIREKVRNEVPEANHAQIDEIINNSCGETTGPAFRISARNNGTKLKDFEFRCNRSEGFRNGQRIPC